ncbi:arginine--tRNA ligase [Actinokineospora globicatena]|uniref:arginine--tRNA ligase n=1 Tax=Actinokineospora globicatena TaxID=103729 RepID=UPI0020A447DF|nr:arginine--tRNA ligase [Actinokineospora globicatena]MCP2305033.1 arginyl-tRNA synthetase [Actinokineospora globicatena]GLW80495.1 arginine--tRNA ligase [Actinokineospora globicatena]GLW87323.1 arginine--tRNA ligase [Actinokineospora globicatena]
MAHGDVGLELGARVAGALRRGLGLEITPAEAVIRPSTREGVDYQCNAAMSLAKKIGKAPREVAQAIVDHLDSADVVEPPEVAGPGFINLRLRDDWLAGRVGSLLGDTRLGVPVVENPRRFALDYGSPNVAKEMHIGHLRSTIIGDAVLRLLRFSGHEVVPHNHLGDWGTPFGMLIEHLLDEGHSADAEISDLNRFYQEARRKFDADPGFADRARARVVALQGGDEETLTLWRGLVAASTRHFQKVYDLLGISLTLGDIYGESFYNPYLDTVIDELTAKGLTEISDGAVCVFPPGFSNREGEPLPLIVRKSDGGYGYAATDMATVRYWITERGMTDLLYAVGTPQAQHFAMIFAASRQAGYLTDEQTSVHINFGTILGEDGKTIRTRSGDSVKLVDLLAEAVEHAAKTVAERSSLDTERQAEVARAVGIGAVKYADLSNDREKDYVFTWSRMLATEGNTSVYLQYANARCQSVLRKAGTPRFGDVVVTSPAERTLLVRLLQLPAAVAAAVESYAPHKLTSYLYDLASTFTTFYDTCPILRPDVADEVRASRLTLTKVTSDVLVLGLDLLGISAPPEL